MDGVLSASELREFKELGFVFKPACFSLAEIAEALESIDKIGTGCRGAVFETNGYTLRALNMSDRSEGEFKYLTHSAKIVLAAEQLLQSAIYIYQFKINMKAAFSGESWRWNQDYIYWKYEDGMPEPRAVTAIIFLDEVTEVNGPLYLIPKSHSHGIIVPGRGGDRGEADWTESFISDLKYQVDGSEVKDLVAENGIVIPKGPPGSVLFIDPNIVHASPENISPMTRKLMLVTYNSISNVPTALSRPEFIVSRDCSPIFVNKS